MSDEYVEKEEIYMVCQKYHDGSWHKLAKAQERWWFDEAAAISWLRAQPHYMQVACAVFKLQITIDTVDKVFDLANADPVEYKRLSYQLLQRSQNAD